VSSPDSIKRVEVTIDDITYEVTREAGGLRAHMAIACPGCKHAAPTYLGGKNQRIAGHDFYEADAWTLCCMHPLGKVRAYCSTLFGLEEDERIAASRCRVYG